MYVYIMSMIQIWFYDFYWRALGVKGGDIPLNIEYM